MSDDWLRADWRAPDNVVAGCTLRTGGVSHGSCRSLNLGMHVDDDSAAVEENRRRFRQMCELPDEPRWLRQVHETNVAVDPLPATRADAAVTSKPGVVCVVQTADCLPVLMAAASRAARPLLGRDFTASITLMNASLVL